MADEADQVPCVTDEPTINDWKSDSETESDVSASFSSSNVVATKMVDKTTPEMVDY
jgi:hypothetical protein